MRIPLLVSYEERHEAKAHGARWDPARHEWYVIDPEDLAPFSRWIPSVVGWPKWPKKVQMRKDSKPGVSTPRTDYSLPDCVCTHVAPWEDCEHTELQLDGDEAQHMRAL